MKQIVRALDVGAHRLHREKLATRHLLERGGMEYVVDAGHCVRNGLRVTDVADVEFHLVGVLRILRLQLMAHIVLFLLVAGEDADLTDIAGQEVLEHGVAEAAGAAGDE